MSIAHLIDDDPVGWHEKVDDLLAYWEGPGAAPASFGAARTRLNAMAATLGLPAMDDDDSGALRRSRINALIDGSGLPAGLDYYADFTTGRMWDNGPASMAAQISDSWSGGLLPNAGGGYDSIATNVLARNSLGLWTQPTRTNRCTNRNANPIDLTGTTKSGDAAAVLTRVDDAAALAAAGLQNICTSGFVYKLDNSAGTTLATVAFAGGTQNTNQHTGSAWVRGTGQFRVGVQNNSGLLAATAGYVRVQHAATPSFVGAQCFVAANAGSVIYFILNGLEELGFATQPIVTSGSAVTRTGNRQVDEVPDGGRAFVLDFDQMEPNANAARILFQWTNGTANSRYVVQLNPGSFSAYVRSVHAGQDDGSANLSIAVGRNILYGVVAPDWLRMGVVGGTETPIATGKPVPVGLSQFSFGQGYAATSNPYIRSRRFGELRNVADPVTAFATVKAIAQGLAA